MSRGALYHGALGKLLAHTLFCTYRHLPAARVPALFYLCMPNKYSAAVWILRLRGKNKYCPMSSLNKNKLNINAPSHGSTHSCINVTSSLCHCKKTTPRRTARTHTHTHARRLRDDKMRRVVSRKRSAAYLGRTAPLAVSISPHASPWRLLKLSGSRLITWDWMRG